jgi:hypothetical protein
MQITGYDVVAGGILGAFFAVIINFSFKRIEETTHHELPVTKYETSASQNTGNKS